MTKPEQPKPIPFPVLLVYGKPTSHDTPQAAWFRVEDRPEVSTAAQALKFSVVDIKTEADRPLIADVHEGVLKAGGRLIVGSVATEVYRRIEQYVRKPAGAISAPSTNLETKGGKATSEQTVNIVKEGAAAPTAQAAPLTAPSQMVAPVPKPPAPETVGGDPLSEQGAPATAPDASAQSASDVKPSAAAAPTPTAPQPTSAPARDPWDALRIGSHVLVKHWEVDGQPYGWWIAIVKDTDKGDYIVRWMDDALKPAFKIERKHIALLHPSFDVTREWEKRR